MENLGLHTTHATYMQQLGIKLINLSSLSYIFRDDLITVSFAETLN